MSRSREITLKEAIEKLLEQYQLQGRLREMKVVELWPKVVGSLIDKHTAKIKVSKGILYVTLDSAALRNELSLSRSKLIKSLNKAAGSEVITDIVFS